MKTFLNKLSGTIPASASVVDGKLILSFPGAINPVVWQMDLSKAKASALEVQEKNGGFALVLKTPNGENLDIAPFDERDKAIQGLMAASRALENAYGQIHSASISNENTPNQTAHAHHGGVEKKKGGKFWPITLGLLFILALLWIWAGMSIEPLNGGYQQSAATQSSASGPQGAADQAGVPVSADDYLQGR